MRTSTRRRPRAPFVVLVVALMALGLVGLLLINTTMQRGAFELTELQERADTLQTREQALQLEVASMSSPDNIATRAARLGMVPNASPAFLRLPGGEVIGRPSPALPGTNLPGISGTTAQREAGDHDRGADADSNGNDDSDGRGDSNGNRNDNRNGHRDSNRNRNDNSNGNDDSDGRGDSNRNRNDNRNDNGDGRGDSNRNDNRNGRRDDNGQRNRDGRDRHHDSGGER